MMPLPWNRKAAKVATSPQPEVRPWHVGMVNTQKMAVEAMSALPHHRWVDVIFHTAVGQAQRMTPIQMRALGQHLDRMADEMERTQKLNGEN